MTLRADHGSLSFAAVREPGYTPRMKVRVALAVLLLATCLSAEKKKAAPPPQEGPAPENMKEYVTAQFGKQFILLEKFPVMTGDLDGDGYEDAVFVVTMKEKENPMGGELDHNYKVIDPYDEYFGWGNPKVTLQFNAHDPDQIRYILIAHGWRLPKATMKYVVINLPFERLALTRHALKKKKLTVDAISAEELGGAVSSVYWDGKKYRWDAEGVN